VNVVELRRRCVTSVLLKEVASALDVIGKDRRDFGEDTQMQKPLEFANNL